MYLYPYKNDSKSCKALADGLDCLQIKKEGSKFKGRANKLVINWGNSVMNEEVERCAVLNKPEAVAICSNKLTFFNKIAEYNLNANGGGRVHIPWYSTSINDAGIIIRNGNKVVCRTVLNGHSGQGIVIAERVDQLVNAPLYVNYVPKKTEYRVHILHDRVVDVQRKARDHNVPDDQVNWQIRNHQFGFVFVRDENADLVPRKVLTNAVNAAKVVGIDFGAVDVIYTERSDTATVLEINTAPGLTGTTLEGYQQRFKEVGKIFEQIMNSRRNKTPAQNAVIAALNRWQQLGAAEFELPQMIHVNQFRPN